MASRAGILGRAVVSTGATDPAPWGSPPTPVLPQWYFEAHQGSHLPLPPALQRLASSKARLLTLGDLATLWELRNEPLAKEEHDALVKMAYRIGRPPDDHVVMPEGLSADRLLQCPLRARTFNCLRRELDGHMPLGPSPLGEVTVGDLLRITNFGLVSLLDLMCVVEAAQNLGYFQEPALAHPYAQSHSALAAHAALPAQDPPEPPDPTEVAWSTATVVLQRLLTAASEISGARTLADALSGDLGGLAAKLGMADHLGEISLADLTGEPQLAHESLSALTELWESLPHVEQTILHKRILAANPLTLEELGETADLTRERIRQIEKRVESRLNHPSITGPAVNCWIGTFAVLLGRELGPITSQSTLEEQVSATFPTPDDPEKQNRAITEMARQLLQQELDYLCSDSHCLSPEARTAIKEIREHASPLADEIGLIDEAALRDCLTGEAWHEHWEALLEESGLHRLSGRLALRDTAKAKAKAALLTIGRPASKEEVGELSGLKPDRAGAQLSLLPGVVRADKHRWGLAEWVDDEYEGIPAEIIQRINEDGGSTRLSRLLEELPRMFNVTPGSVTAYAKTARFQISDGHVSLADPSSLKLRDLDDIVHGRTADGQPFWSFKVEDRYLDGYSLVGMPPEIAKALGCEPDGRVRIPVLSPAGCGPVSVGWSLSSLAGASLGYLSEPLKLLGAKGGHSVKLVLEHSGVSLKHLRSQNPVSSSMEARKEDLNSDKAKDFIERMKRRRRSL